MSNLKMLKFQIKMLFVVAIFALVTIVVLLSGNLELGLALTCCTVISPFAAAIVFGLTDG